jgi:predicted nucleotidyltransferase
MKERHEDRRISSVNISIAYDEESLSSHGKVVAARNALERLLFSQIDMAYQTELQQLKLL